jgi:methionyl-tRNA formyltransferase
MPLLRHNTPESFAESQDSCAAKQKVAAVTPWPAVVIEVDQKGMLFDQSRPEFDQKLPIGHRDASP